jgi:alkylation response protein AidB-like acyl-CoA dehydrogenase
MRFAFTEDQELSRKSFRDLLERACTPAILRRAWDDETGTLPGLSAAFTEFGLPGLLAPESAGGMGLTDVDLVLLLEEAGRAAVPGPFLEAAAIAVPLLAALSTDRRAADLLRRAARGTALVLVGLESERYVSGAHLADALVLERNDEAHIVARNELDIVRQSSVDGSRHLARIRFRPDETTLVARGAVAMAAFGDARCRGAIAASAELVGLGARLIEVTVEYAKTRRQFGQPIGAFQAVKHQLADAYLGIAFARPLVHRAAYSMAHADSARAVHASAAKAAASDAAGRAARVALQVHGAIGYSFEHDLHLWMKRIWALGAAWGDAISHRTRIADHLLGESPK